MYRNQGEFEEEREDDIPPAEIDNGNILLGTTKFPLIMAYSCPICQQPLIAYWKITDPDERATDNTVGRALRDSGFGGYRFFQTSNGQGFEFDPEKDPRKRHQHIKNIANSWEREPRYEEFWLLFIKLNPLFSVNDFLCKILDPMESKFPKGHMFIKKQSRALRLINKEFAYRKDVFKIVKDKMNHGKPLFYFNFVKYQDAVRYTYDDADKLRKFVNFIGEETLREIDLMDVYNMDDILSGE